jgi:hypothetical protein
LFLLPDSGDIEHITPLVAGGTNSEDNLCLACSPCNSYKGVQIAVVDPLTWQTVPLFHPRRQVWTEHFGWTKNAIILVGRTACGRATIAALRMNRPHLVRARGYWKDAGWHPAGLTPKGSQE